MNCARLRGAAIGNEYFVAEYTEHFISKMVGVYIVARERYGVCGKLHKPSQLTDISWL